MTFRQGDDDIIVPFLGPTHLPGEVTSVQDVEVSRTLSGSKSRPPASFRVPYGWTGLLGLTPIKIEVHRRLQTPVFPVKTTGRLKQGHQSELGPYDLRFQYKIVKEVCYMSWGRESARIKKKE